jgi:hypothetical protein
VPQVGRGSSTLPSATESRVSFSQACGRTAVFHKDRPPARLRGLGLALYGALSFVRPVVQRHDFPPTPGRRWFDSTRDDFSFNGPQVLWRHASTVRREFGFNSRADLGREAAVSRAARPAERRLPCKQEIGVRLPGCPWSWSSEERDRQTRNGRARLLPSRDVATHSAGASCSRIPPAINAWEPTIGEERDRQTRNGRARLLPSRDVATHSAGASCFRIQPAVNAWEPRIGRDPDTARRASVLTSAPFFGA